MSTGGEPIIIKKKKKGGHGGHHGGAWKVAYADFVTAMMAFFLVMWLVSQGKPVKQAVGGYFRDPGVFELQRTHGVLTGGVTADQPKPDASAPVTSDRLALEQTAQHIRERLMQAPDLKTLSSQIELTVTPEGLRIDLLERDKSSFFDSGSAKLRPETVRILGLISRELGGLPNPVTIEGHTDSRPYATPNGYTNWELSADRANAARRAMAPQGLHEGQLTGVIGLADRQPRNVRDPLDASNRRVSILVKSEAVAGEVVKTVGAKTDAVKAAAMAEAPRGQ